MMKAHFILFVSDQAASTAFYSSVLASEPRLNVPGMTEFELVDGAVLGLMPQDSAKRLFEGAASIYSATGASLRSELYAVVDDAASYHARALAAGAAEISPLIERDWGHTAAYCTDRDGHLLAFAQLTGSENL